MNINDCLPNWLAIDEDEYLSTRYVRLVKTLQRNTQCTTASAVFFFSLYSQRNTWWWVLVPKPLTMKELQKSNSCRRFRRWIISSHWPLKTVHQSMPLLYSGNFKNADIIFCGKEGMQNFDIFVGGEGNMYTKLNNSCNTC